MLSGAVLHPNLSYNHAATGGGFGGAIAAGKYMQSGGNVTITASSATWFQSLCFVVDAGRPAFKGHHCIAGTEALELGFKCSANGS